MRHRSVDRYAVIFAAAILGCNEAAISPVVTPQLTPELTSIAAGVPARVRQAEMPFAELAQRAPSTAGFYFDDGGSLVILVRDERDNDAALARMAELVNT